MERYNRAYRDPRSPLTPITPLSTQVFNFDDTSASSIDSTYQQRKNSLRSLRTSQLTRLARSSEYTRARSVFSPTARSTTIGASRSSSSTFLRPPRLGCVIKQEPPTQTTISQAEDTTRPRIKREFKKGSPVEQPTLSPRVRSLLDRTGNTHLTEMFTRQEIDIQVLIRMTLEDLEALGVRGAKELKLALDLIKFAKRFF